MSQYDFWKTTPPEPEIPDCYYEQAEEELEEAEEAGTWKGGIRDEWIADRAYELYQIDQDDAAEARYESAQVRLEMDKEMY